ncbi:MAG: dCTP deaminase domain-containing protein [Methanothrix sp.]
MNYNSIIITGTTGAGKAGVCSNLIDKYDIFEIAETNNIFSLENFQSIFRVLNDQSKIPIFIIFTENLRDIVRNEQLGSLIRPLNIFIDAPDELLDRNLRDRNEIINEATFRKRQEDREFEKNCIYILSNTNLGNTVELIWDLWRYQMTGGVLSKRLIKLMISCGMLLRNADIGNIKSASYDLSIGDEYYYSGKIKALTDRDPFILIEPYDYAIVTSKEIADMPRDVIGRFDLSVSLFCQGIILSNGPQVDPGFKGRLFCLLFNTSNALISLKRGQHYATIEFNKMVEPSESYQGKYQDKDKIVYYLPSNSMRGAINELKKEIENVRNESKNLQNTFLAITSLILAIIALLIHSK